MPNWTQNRLEFTGPADQLQKVRELLASVDADGQPVAIDFEKIAPMPAILHRVISPVRKGDNGRTMLSVDNGKPFSFDHVEATEAEQAEIDDQDSTDWYSWSVKHWGVKWNACRSEETTDSEEAVSYAFETAWDAPRAFYETMMTKVREIAPDVQATATASFEDDGYEAEETLLAA